MVEIRSPSEDPRDKLDFYAAVGTREVLLIDRDPWGLELYRLDGDVLRSTGLSDEGSPVELVSEVMPLTFRLQPGTQSS